MSDTPETWHDCPGCDGGGGWIDETDPNAGYGGWVECPECEGAEGWVE